VGTQTQNGRSYPFYRCPATGDCKDRMAIGAEIAEGVVVGAVRAVLDDVEGRASTTSRARFAERELARAQRALDDAIRAFADLSGEPVAVETLRTLAETRDTAQERLDRVGGASTVTLPIGKHWDDLLLDGQRALVKAVVDRALVGPGKGAGRISVEFVQ
jgi:uncharacterized Zn finger protein